MNHTDSLGSTLKKHLNSTLSNQENASINICRLIKMTFQQTGSCTNIRSGRHLKGLDTPWVNTPYEDRLVLCDVKSSGVVDFSGSVSLHWGTDSHSGNCFVGKTELLRLRESRWRNWPDKTDKRERGRLWERWRRGGGGRVEVSVRHVATVMGDIQPAARRIYRQAGFRQDSSARFLHTRTHTHSVFPFIPLFSKIPSS